jgi:RimJ/RimL family protein N-acetyltransferase
MRYDDGSQQLILRPGRVEDAEAVLEATLESLTEMRRFMTWAHLPQTLELQRERLTQAEKDYASRGDMIFHAFAHDGGPYVGTFGLLYRSLNPQCLEVGYWVRTSAAGRGVATLATQCLCVLAFDYFDCVRVQCGFNEANRTSRRVNTKVGFVEEARLRYFQAQPTPQMQQDGCLIAPMMIITVLFPEECRGQHWYSGVFEALSVFDADGCKVASQHG